MAKVELIRSHVLHVELDTHTKEVKLIQKDLEKPDTGPKITIVVSSYDLLRITSAIIGHLMESMSLQEKFIETSKDLPCRYCGKFEAQHVLIPHAVTGACEDFTPPFPV